MTSEDLRRARSRTSGPAQRADKRDRTRSAARRRALPESSGARPIDFNISPFSLIERALSPSGEPVLGLHLHVAHMALLSSFEQQLGLHEVTPNWVGILALVEHYPGISQIALAKLIRLERASVGERVARCISKGFIKRVDAPDDRRRYELYLTARGERTLQRLREHIPAHERHFTAALTDEERLTLKELLDKLVPDWARR